MTGVTDNESDRRVRSAIRNAQHTGSHCAGCQRQLAPNEPVWRRRMSLGRGLFGGWRYTIAPACQSCRGEWTEYQRPFPCEGCGRPVNNQLTRRWRRRTFCGAKCEADVRAREAREKRQRARSTTQTCAACGQAFEPARSDAKFCSAGCKQIAYRRRVTDRKCRPGPPSDIRNADETAISYGVST